jgi:very-short-patch-repair endonuclease
MLGDMANRNARTLRRNMTDAERVLWYRIRHKQIDGHRFRRQVPIGPYIVDFACLDVRLIVEIDGGQHGDAVVDDGARDAWLAARGYRVFRLWNNDVIGNIDGVLEHLRDALHAETPHPNPPPQGGRG